MMDPEEEAIQAAIEDAEAIVEDTVHCDFCFRSWVLGGNEDGLVLTPTAIRGMPPSADGIPPPICQLKLCRVCVAYVGRSIQLFLMGDDDVCPHGEIVGDWCEACVLEAMDSINEMYEAREAGDEARDAETPENA